MNINYWKCIQNKYHALRIIFTTIFFETCEKTKMGSVDLPNVWYFNQWPFWFYILRLEKGFMLFKRWHDDWVLRYKKTTTDKHNWAVGTITRLRPNSDQQKQYYYIFSSPHSPHTSCVQLFLEAHALQSSSRSCWLVWLYCKFSLQYLPTFHHAKFPIFLEISVSLWGKNSCLAMSGCLKNIKPIPCSAPNSDFYILRLEKGFTLFKR